MKKISTVSDLHMFCRRSEADDHMDGIYQAAKESDIFVLNGDTFDFRWSTHQSTEDTVEAAVAWLHDLTEHAKDTDIRFVLGNHDHVQDFIDRLKVLVEEKENLQWHPYYFKYGNAMFLHGDVANKKMTAKDLEAYRFSWLHHEQQGEFVNKVYDMAFKAGIHKVVNKIAFPTEIIVDRIRHYLDDIGEGEGSDTTHVYFGHTHVAVDDYEYKGQRFFNSGAPMPGLPFNIINTKAKAASGLTER